MSRALALPLLPLLAACPLFGGSNDGPGGVGMGGSFERDPSCELDGTLVVELGDGSDGFAALVDGEGPTVHHGSQGGTHMFVGVRIGALALDRYELVRVVIGAFDPAQCEAAGEPCTTPAQWFSGEWVLGDAAPLDPLDEHTIVQDQLAARFDIHGQPLVLQAYVDDPCGQVGWAQARFTAGE